MIDLFVVVTPKRAIPRGHALEPTKGFNRKEYERDYHRKNRERRIALMKARYEKKRAEYIEKARAWALQHPDKVREIKRNSKRRIKRKVALQKIQVRMFP